MNKILAILAVPLLAMAAPQSVLAKSSVLKIRPEGSQVATMESGAQIITSELPGSIVVMRTPEPFDGSRTKIFFSFVNKGDAPVNVGPENISATQIAVVSYDKLLAEQKNSEGWDRALGALGAISNSLSASNAGRQSTVTSYSGYADCGFSCGGTFRGSAVSQTYNPYAAQQARLQAEAENRAAASAMHTDHAIARNAIAANLRTTTVMPGQFITGMLTFDVPRSVRRGKTATPVVIYIRMGADLHALRGYAGAIGTTPPPDIASSAAQAVDPGASSSAASSSPIAGPKNSYAHAEALYHGRGVQQDAPPIAERSGWAQAITKPQTTDPGDDEYTYGFRLWAAGLFPEARKQLAIFVEQYPNHARISFGSNLLGRAFLDDNMPEEAARWFLHNYQADKNADRAPDSLLYLGASMIMMNDTKRACVALAKFTKAYPFVAAGRLATDYQGIRAKVKCG